MKKKHRPHLKIILLLVVLLGLVVALQLAQSPIDIRQRAAAIPSPTKQKISPTPTQKPRVSPTPAKRKATPYFDNRNPRR